jgi:maltooligosyltrehalose trehalohydrolase
MPVRTHHFGPVPQDNGYTRFALWAPDAKTVHLQLEGGDVLPMESHEGWFGISAPAMDGTGYRFLIDNELSVPDPAANAQRGDIHDWSLVVNHAAYHWNCADWRGRPWHETIIYELHVGLMGGFAGVTRHLPLLMELGITAIELMPLHEFPGSRNWGYDGALLFAPEASYGSPAELKHLVDCAHELGIMVFVDVVYNHFGPDGNYLGRYASPFFRQDEHTPWGAAIDFGRTEVRDFFIGNALMWVLDYRVDGLRFDAVHAIQDTQFLVDMAAQIRAAVPGERHVHLMLENEHNAASLLSRGFTAQWNDDGHNILHHLLTGEHEGYYADFAEQPTAKLARFLNEGFIFQGQATRQGKTRGEPSGHLPPTAFILFLQNHDQIGNRAFGERIHQLANRQALEAAMVLVLLSPMVPLLFMGEEWGADQPFLYFTDHNDELAEAVCNGRRNEFAAFSLFAEENNRDQIPDPNAADTFNRSRLDYAACLQPEHRERLNFYRELVALRNQEIVPRLAGARADGTRILGDKAVSACWILNDGRELRIDLNLSAQAVPVNPPWEGNRILYDYRVGSHHQDNILPALSALASLEHPHWEEDAVDRIVDIGQHKV